MATVNQKYVTFYDLAQLPENEQYRDIVDMASQINPILTDALALPTNDGSSHKSFIRTGLPSGIWRRLYQGIPSTKGTFQSITDTTGRLMSVSEVDAELVDVYEKAEDKASVRMVEATGHIESLSQDIAEAIIYSDSTIEPGKPMGIAPRFNDLSAENASQIIDAGGTGNELTSIYMITWHEQGAHLIYPRKGTSPGITRHDMGEILMDDPLEPRNKFRGYREEFSWYLGVVVKNWEYLARVANIDVSTLTEDASTGADIVSLMTRMYYSNKGRRKALGKTIIYVPTVVLMFLDFQARNAQGRNLFLTYQDTGPNAKEVLHFRGVPIHELDAIITNEEQVV